jgi:hypothetical protein
MLKLFLNVDFAIDSSGQITDRLYGSTILIRLFSKDVQQTVRPASQSVETESPVQPSAAPEVLLF